MLRMNFCLIVAIILMVALVEMACGQTVLDFTTGLPEGVEPKQASGSIVHYPSYKCCHVYGDWYLPWTLQEGERVEIDLNPRYEISGGIILGNGTRKAINRYTVSPVVVTTPGPLGFYGGDQTLANRVQWFRARYYPNPTPTPTETPTETPTDTATETPTSTPSPTPTIDYGNWWPVWRIVKNSQDVIVFEKWLVPPGVTMVRVESGNAVAGEGE